MQLSRHLADGTLDISFDANGFVRHALDSNTSLVSGVIDGDGSFFYLTRFVDPSSSFRSIRFQVCKLNSSGAKDSSFGASGCLSLGSTSEELAAKDLSVGVNGFLYIQASQYDATEPDWDLRERSVLLRIDKNTGVLDTTVGTSGFRYYQSDKGSTQLWSSIVLPTNSIINVVEDAGIDGSYIEKRNSDYQIDSTFAANISAFRSAYSHVMLFGAFLGDGRLHVYGYDTVSSNTVLMAFSYDGVFDSTFGGSGFVQLPDEYSWGFWNSPVVDSLGRIIVFGSFTESGTPNISHILVKRFLANGLIDSSFDGDGMVDVTSLVNDNVEAVGLVIGPSNSLYVYVTAGYDSDVSTSLIRIDSSGNRDLSFAGSGVYQVSGPSGVQIQSLLVGPGGELYLAIKDGNDLKLRIRKLSSHGVVDTSFGTSGEWVSAETYLGFSLGGGMAFDNRPGHTDKILVYSAIAGNPASLRRLQVHRLTAGGNIDASFGTFGVLSKDVSEFGGVSLANRNFLCFSLTSDGSIFAAFTGYSPEDGVFIKLR